MMVRLTEVEEILFQKILGTYIENEHVQSMKNYIQHGCVTTFEHCYEVARLSLWINRRFHLKANERTLLIGAFLHDFYLYDWHNEDGGTHNLHGFYHPGVASKNAKRIFNVTKREQQIIESHMWPLTLTKIPKHREAVIVCLADKYCSTVETLFRRRKGRYYGLS